MRGPAFLIAATVALPGCHLVFGVDGDVVDPDSRSPLDAVSGECEPSLVTDGLVAWYPMKALEGATLSACEGDSGTCQPGRCPMPTTGPYGPALAFDVDSFVEVSGARLGPSSEGQISVAFWLRVDTLSGVVCPVRKLLGDGTAHSWSLCLDPGLQIAIASWTDTTPGTVTIQAAIATGVWQRVVMRSDGNNADVALGGTRPTNPVHIVGIANDGGSMLLGSDRDRTHDTAFDGALADVRIYNRWLADDEVDDLSTRPQP